MTAAHWISDGSDLPAVPLKSPQLQRAWTLGRYEIARTPRRGRWAISVQGGMTANPDGTQTMTGRGYGVAGYRTLIGAIIATWRMHRQHP